MAATSALLHGTLDVTISKRGEDHNTPATSRKGKAKQEASLGTKFFSTVYLEVAEAQRIKLDKKNITVEGNVTHHIYCAHEVSKVRVTVQQKQTLGKRVTSKDVLVHEILRGEIDLLLEVGDHSFEVKLKFTDVKRDDKWSNGLWRVDGTYSKENEGCKVSLYQDAHVPSNFSPGITLDGGLAYQPQRCWEDIYNKIKDAKKIIYIAGWSVHPEINLIRDPETIGKDPKNLKMDKKLYDLLKGKAEEAGVTVLMLIWDDKIRYMGTGSKETVECFKDTNVRCAKCTRKSVGVSLKPLMNAHHQKTVVVDVESPGEGPNSNKREIVAFVGGIDLCGGRYDTPYHSLFSTLNSEHKDDFHQPNFRGSAIEKGGPREPWHDIHAKVEGPAAWDILCNFEQRWRKQVDKNHISLNGSDNISAPQLAKDDDEAWNVQVFRSIDGGVAADDELPDNYHDHGIQDAYINAIRRAKNFIYIETQYFLGSSFAWAGDKKHRNPANLIPKELSLKIVSKIEAEEPFTVYIVLPMWPEGVPESDTVQTILYAQKRTMQLMYDDVIGALKKKGINDTYSRSREYLTFFCLGNREPFDPSKKHQYDPPKERPEQGSDYRKAQDARRFMIYVHSKMMIVDDEYIIIGSSNINDRSMDGGRDTEIAIGAYQPKYSARGQIHGFRKSLWFEHLGNLEPCFDNPGTQPCVQRVNQLADANWELYCQEEPVNLPGHLLRYPVEIRKEDEAIVALKGQNEFPDTNAPILGSWETNNPALRLLDNATLGWTEKLRYTER